MVTTKCFFFLIVLLISICSQLQQTISIRSFMTPQMLFVFVILLSILVFPTKQNIDAQIIKITRVICITLKIKSSNIVYIHQMEIKYTVYCNILYYIHLCSPWKAVPVYICCIKISCLVCISTPVHGPDTMMEQFSNLTDFWVEIAKS